MGLFDRQKLFRGEKLTEAFAEGEKFVLWDLALVCENETRITNEGPVDKTELIVSKDGAEPFLASTLSSAIKEIAVSNVRDSKGKPKADDLPCLCTWKRVETKASRTGSQSPAVVLDMQGSYSGKMTGTPPEFSFEPITLDNHPL